MPSRLSFFTRVSRTAYAALRAVLFASGFTFATVIGAPAWAQETSLGPAPRADVPQDTFGASTRGLEKAARTRGDVVALYRASYLAGNAVPLNWNGSVASCNAGTSNVEHQQAVIDRVNYYRALVDLPPVALPGAALPLQEQAAALMFSANAALSHAPPTNWLCYSASGASGAGTSNIALGGYGVQSIDLYMDDFGSGNEAVGHRRWVLYPPQVAMATGDVPRGNFAPWSANALYVLGPFGTRPVTPIGIAWPPAGFVPYQNLPAQSNRWSFSYPQANFAAATVTITGPAGTMPVTYEANANGYGDNAIVFKPGGMSYARPTVDTSYLVTVSGMTGPAVPASVQYTVTVIDPDAANPAAPTVDVVEYYNAALDHYFITWNAAEMANLDAGRTPTRWVRTGYTFKAYASAQPGSSPVCRFYIPPSKGDSHFFGRGTAECDATGQRHPDFVLEDGSFMFMFLPTGGTCSPGMTPVYRVFSNRTDANHRYMTDRAVRAGMVSRGWLPEGDGPDLVAMCAPP